MVWAAQKRTPGDTVRVWHAKPSGRYIARNGHEISCPYGWGSCCYATDAACRRWSPTTGISCGSARSTRRSTGFEPRSPAPGNRFCPFCPACHFACATDPDSRAYFKLGGSQPSIEIEADSSSRLKPTVDAAQPVHLSGLAFSAGN